MSYPTYSDIGILQKGGLVRLVRCRPVELSEVLCKRLNLQKSRLPIILKFLKKHRAGVVYISNSSYIVTEAFFREVTGREPRNVVSAEEVAELLAKQEARLREVMSDEM